MKEQKLAENGKTMAGYAARLNDLIAEIPALEKNVKKAIEELSEAEKFVDEAKVRLNLEDSKVLQAAQTQICHLKKAIAKCETVTNELQKGEL